MKILCKKCYSHFTVGKYYSFYANKKRDVIFYYILNDKNQVMVFEDYRIDPYREKFLLSVFEYFCTDNEARKIKLNILKNEERF